LAAWQLDLALNAEQLRLSSDAVEEKREVRKERGGRLKFI
jgi:hypothetical protein